MAYTLLQITVISAKGLNGNNLLGERGVSATVSLSNDPRSKQETHVDKDGGKNPTWNFPMKLKVPDHGPPVILLIQLGYNGSFGHRNIGEVHIPIEDLLNTASSGDGPSSEVQFVRYPVIKPSGKPKGILNLSFKFGKKVSSPVAAAAATPVAVAAKGDESVTAYHSAAGPGGYPRPGGGYHLPAASFPAPAGQYPLQPAYPAAYAYSGYTPPPLQSYSYGYPPPPPAYGYPPPPPAYRHPPPPPAYGYQVQVGPPPRGNNNFWMGLSERLLGRVVEDLLIGEMTSDSSDAYVAGYDA